MPGACGKGSRIFCRPRTACREKASATYRTSGRSLDLKIKSGTNRMPRQTDTAEPFPRRDDTHATSRQRNDTLTSLPSMPLIPTRTGPYFAKQNRDDAPPAVPKPQRLPRHDPEYPTAHGYPRFSLIYAPASLYKTDYIPHHGKRTVRTTETEPRYIHPTLSVICRTPDKIQNQTYGKSSGVLCGRRCLSIFRLQKTGLSLHPVRPAYGQATSRAHRRKSAERRSWRPTRR